MENQEYFKIKNISSELEKEMIEKKIWSDWCPVQIKDLRLIKISYYGFDNQVHNDGEMVVLDILAEPTVKIFKSLLHYQFPIEKIKLINEYNGNDEASMNDNNSSAFNCRKIAGSENISLHAYGAAIDINPVQNPYIILPDQNTENIEIHPKDGVNYINRSNIRKGMVETILDKNKNLTVVDLFKENGFTVWGGKWNKPIDWHHFQITREEANNTIYHK